MFPTRNRNRYSMANIPGAMPMMPPSDPPMTPPTDQYDPLQMGQRRRPGLFGRLGQAITGNGTRDWGNVLGTIGATLQQMDGGTELSDYIAARDDQAMRRDMFGQQVRRGKLEEADAESAAARQAAEARAAEAERQQMEKMIAQLPPDQQMLARLNRQAFVGGMMRHRYPAPQRGMGDDQRPDDDDGWTYED